MADLEVRLMIGDGRALIGVIALSAAARRTCRLRYNEGYCFDTIQEVQDFLADPIKAALSVHDADGIVGG